MEIKKIGAHVSAAGGLHMAVEKAYQMGCNCVQLFSGSPRVWARKSLAEIDVDKLFSKIRETSVTPIFTHALYLVNFASDKPDLLRKSFDSIKYELEFDALVKGSGVVVHLGSHQGRGWDSVKVQVCEELAKLLKATPLTSRLLIENSAGQQGKVGSPLDEIKLILDELERIGGYVSSNRVGWCFDTCHAHASGYMLAPGGGKKTGQESLLETKVLCALDEIDRLELWSTLYCIHVNDSKDIFDSGRDRHANIGDGNIPTEELKAFLNNKHVVSRPLILEVPGLDEKGPDAENVNRLKKLVGIDQAAKEVTAV